MFKKEFIKKLKKELKALPAAETNRALDYYSELIDDRMESGSTEEAAISAMGDIGAIAANIKADAIERGVPLKKNSHTAGWAVLTILLITVSICALAFCAWAFITKVLGEDLSFAKVEWTEHTAVCDISKNGSITVDLTRSDILYGLSDDDKVHITYYDCDRVKVELEHDENSISMIQKGRLMWLYEMFGSNDKRQAKVLIPAGFEGLIKSTVTTGETRVDHLICPVAKTEFHSTTGDFIVYDSSMHDVTFTMTTGDLILGRCTVAGGDLNVKGTTGGVDIDQTGCGDLTIDMTTGDIKLKTIIATNIEVGVTTAGIILNESTAGSVYLHTTTGSIAIDRLTANDIKLTSTTGSISGTLEGSITDYTIESHVTTGHNSLPESFGSGAKKLFVKATTGDISVTFTENN